MKKKLSNNIVIMSYIDVFHVLGLPQTPDMSIADLQGGRGPQVMNRRIIGYHD